MGSSFNFKDIGNEPPTDERGTGTLTSPPGDFSLSRQLSIYSLTFDEFQSTMGSGIMKDFGSMNIDELMKSIWSAEEAQNMAAAAGSGQEVGNRGQSGYLQGQGSGYLQGQGSLTLPRTLSQKTVDEVWRDISTEFDGGGDDGDAAAGNLSQRQQTNLGEVTLEEFLIRAGVFREDAVLATKNNEAGVLVGDGAQSCTCSNLGFGCVVGLMGTHIRSDNPAPLQPYSPPFDVSSGVISSQRQPSPPPRLPPQPPRTTRPSNSPLGGSDIRGGVVGLADHAINSDVAQGAGLPRGGLALGALAGGPVGVAAGSPVPAATSDHGVAAMSNGDTTSVVLQAAPYSFNGGIRGRKYNNTTEKVIERRQRRMIKNRESAARSRARKQAYTMELEQEVAKLKEDNQELRKKQVEIMEMQKKQALEVINAQHGRKRQRLRRAHTGPW